MAIKTSFSQTTTYISCSKYWDWSYNHKYKSPVEGASLYFGSAVDSAVMALLEGKPGYMELFRHQWHAQTNKNKKTTQVFDSEDIVYSYNDFDEDVLELADEHKLVQWAEELGLDKDVYEQLGLVKHYGVALYKDIAKRKKNTFKRLSKEELTYFNRASWLSLLRKGELLIESFRTQFLPKVKKVHATQLYAKVDDPDSGDVINGFIDMILTIDGYDKPIIFDLKTSGQRYTQEQIDLTEQLTLYAGFKAKEYDTNLVGYVVLVKNISKESTYACAKCGHSKDGKHKTCNSIVDKVRCSGEWIKTKVLKPEVQVLVEQKSEEQVQALYKDYENVILAMKNKIVYKNTSKCNNWYSQKCVYYDLCHHGSDKGLIKS